MEVIRKGPAPVEVECAKCRSLLSVSVSDVQAGSGSDIVVCCVCQNPMRAPAELSARSETQGRRYTGNLQDYGMAQIKAHNWTA